MAARGTGCTATTVHIQMESFSIARTSDVRQQVRTESYGAFVASRPYNSASGRASATAMPCSVV